MKSETINLPLFPLDIFLLPGGITRLRIFEARYLKMVSLAATVGGFIISCDNQTEQKLIKWGSWVEVINFDQGDDGILEIDVKCKSLVEYSTIQQDKDKLHFVDIKKFKHWSQKQSNADLLLLSGSLQSLFKNNVLLDNLYTEKLTSNPYWVVSRWLELLPIPVDIKNSFVFESSYIEAKKLINSIIL
tara:strand:+ start:3019 stop:3582 length:564 start_codon:yes stop_codon:yes gene_type:complete